jgi:IPT/TIG domain
MPEDEEQGVKVPWWGTVPSLLWLVLLSVLCLYALVALWPHPTPSGGPPTEEMSKSVPPATEMTKTAATKTDTTKTDITKTDTTKTDTTKTDTTSPAKPDTAKTVAVLCPPGSADEQIREECACWTRVAKVRALYSLDNPKADKNDPSCVYLIFFGWKLIWGETRLLLIVMLCGFLGSLIYSLRSFFWYTGNRNLVVSWLALYALVPVVGAMLAVVFYLVVRGGFFSPATTISDTSPFGFAAVAALVGMFTNQAAEKLRTVFETLMTKAQTGKDPSARTAPLLANVTPSPVPHGQDQTLTVTGDNFYADSKVWADATELTTTFRNEKQLQATLPAALIPNPPGSIAISVVTPNAGKSILFKVTVS